MSGFSRPDHLHEDLFISPGDSVKTAMRRMDNTGKRIVFAVDEMGKLLGVLSDGDIRRIVLNGRDLDDRVDEYINRQPVVVTHGTSTMERCRELFLQRKISCIPVVDELERVTDFVTWDEAFETPGEITEPHMRKIEPKIPVVIMAGGRGTRMMPFTTVLPKPLIPIGEKTIIEMVAENIHAQGPDHFYLTVNYRGEMIKAYLDGISIDYHVDYIWEREFLGTAGSLKLVPPELGNLFLVTNCDVIVRAKYADIVEFHRNHGAVLTIISSIQHVSIPYGVVDFGSGGSVTAIREKPELTFPINTGVYIVGSRALDFIPDGTAFDMTQLIQALLEAGEKVATYPVNEKDYRDIGQWEEFRRSAEALRVR